MILMPDAGDVVNPVLNALRHQRFGTLTKMTQTIRPMSAQRLTASEVWHYLTKSPKDLNLKCSTPYGIRGLALHSPLVGVKKMYVLNALRHQRFGTSLQALLFLD